MQRGNAAAQPQVPDLLRSTRTSPSPHHVRVLVAYLCLRVYCQVQTHAICLAIPPISLVCSELPFNFPQAPPIFTVNGPSMEHPSLDKAAVSGLFSAAQPPFQSKCSWRECVCMHVCVCVCVCACVEGVGVERKANHTNTLANVSLNIVMPCRITDTTGMLWTRYVLSAATDLSFLWFSLMIFLQTSSAPLLSSHTYTHTLSHTHTHTHTHTHLAAVGHDVRPWPSRRACRA